MDNDLSAPEAASILGISLATLYSRAAPRLGRTAAGYFSEDGSAPMGFRHRLYPDGDPRAAYLLNRLSTVPVEAKNAAEVIGDCIEEGKRRGHLPNADFALAAMQPSAYPNQPL